MIYKHRKNNFSLIELISVLAITGIFLGLALPSMDTILRGQSTEQAAINFGAVLNAVRSYAISNKKYVALIIPDESSNLPDQYENKSYRPCVVDRNMNFMYWVRDNKWEFLPTTSAVLDIDKISKSYSGSFEEATDITGVQFKSIKPKLKGIVFKPSGLKHPINQNQSETFVVIGNPNILGGKALAYNLIDIKIDQYSGIISY